MSEARQGAGSGGSRRSGGAGEAPAPASSGAVLGVRVLRNSGVHGTALAVASFLQLVLLFVVAHFLGAAELGRFGLLYFGAGLLGQVLMIACKPGTLRRTFGAGDDEDDDEDEEDTSDSPKRSLGTGLILATVLSLAAAAAVVVGREPIADLLLGSSEDAELVVWAAVLGAATSIFRLVSIVIWFERRQGAYLVTELIRPALALLVATVLLAAGGDLESVLIGGATGAIAGAALGFFLLRNSFEPAFALGEAGQILQRGVHRAPIMSSFWVLGNADVFLLSRYVDHADLGVYTLASRVGFIAAFMPQGFRVAMRPLRKAAIFKAVEDQYGRGVQRGQLLGYFVLVCIFAVLTMVLVSEIVVEIVPESFADAAPLIPVTAAAMVWPALMRTVNQQASWPRRTRAPFILGTVLGALAFIAVTLLLAPEIGVYAAPVGVIAGLAPPTAYLFVRCQRGPDRIAFPYRSVLVAGGLAVAVGGAYAALPAMPLALDALAALAGAMLFALGSLRFGVVPTEHRPALLHMARSAVGGRPDQFNPRRGLRALEPEERGRLRSAVDASWARNRAGGGDGAADLADEAAARRLVRTLRRAGIGGGVAVEERDRRDARIAEFLFTGAPTAIRNATMRRLLADGAEADDLRTLEDLVEHLATIPDDAWEGARGRRRLLARFRRRAGVR